jgi:hypothetical protein
MGEKKISSVILRKGLAFANHAGGESLCDSEDEWGGPLSADAGDKLYSFQPPEPASTLDDLKLNRSPRLVTRVFVALLQVNSSS